MDIAKIGIDQGLLNLNASLLADAYGRIHNEMVIENATFADGIHADGSFSQHGGVIYNGNYGKVVWVLDLSYSYSQSDLFLTRSVIDLLLLEIVAGGTQFTAGDVAKAAFANLIGADLWMIYHNAETGVSHWDFVRLFSRYTTPSDSLWNLERLGTLY